MKNLTPSRLAPPECSKATAGPGSLWGSCGTCRPLFLLMSQDGVTGCRKRTAARCPEFPLSSLGSMLTHSLNLAPSKAPPGGEGDTVRPRAYCCSQLVTGRINVWGATYLRWALKSWKGGGNEAKMRAVFDNDIFCHWKQGWNMTYSDYLKKKGYVY